MASPKNCTCKDVIFMCVLFRVENREAKWKYSCSDSDLVFHEAETHPERSFPLMSLSNATLSIYIYCRTLCGIFS